jgi:hypothetical protein
MWTYLQPPDGFNALWTLAREDLHIENPGELAENCRNGIVVAYLRSNFVLALALVNWFKAGHSATFTFWLTPHLRRNRAHYPVRKDIFSEFIRNVRDSGRIKVLFTMVQRRSHSNLAQRYGAKVMGEIPDVDGPGTCGIILVWSFD